MTEAQCDERIELLKTQFEELFIMDRNFYNRPPAAQDLERYRLLKEAIRHSLASLDPDGVEPRNLR